MLSCEMFSLIILDGYKELDAFKLTPLGAALLDSLLIQGSGQ